MSQSSPNAAAQAATALVTYSARLGRATSRVSDIAVPAATLRLLSLLDEVGPAGVGELAQADRCSQPTMSGAVRHLVDNGWARKSPHPYDARASIVELTEAGADVLAESRRRISDVLLERLAADPCHDVVDVEAAVRLLQHLLQPQEGTS
ncbi:MAG: MarR family winged helix-turn-helix transcriptional regulator [Nocardioides sp.]